MYHENVHLSRDADTDTSELQSFCQSVTILVFGYLGRSSLVDLYQSFTAHQHQKGHTVPKQVSPLDDDGITESTRKKKCYGSTV